MWRSSNRGGRANIPEDAASSVLFMSYSSPLCRMHHAPLLRRKDRRDVWDRIEVSGCCSRSCDHRVRHYGDESRERPDCCRYCRRLNRGCADRRSVGRSAGLCSSAASSGILWARARRCGGAGLQACAGAILGRIWLSSPAVSRLRLTGETPLGQSYALAASSGLSNLTCSDERQGRTG
jgi:hypothetical protein